MEELKLSKRAQTTPPSPIRRLAHLALKARSEGVHVYHLNIGQPDIRSPQEFLDAVHDFNQEIVAYDQSEGNAELRTTWSAFMNRSLDVAVKPENFLITTGASEALIFLFMTCCDPGDEVIIFDPTYANYIGFAAIAGVKLVPIRSRLEEGFGLPPTEKIQAAITERTRALLLCNPNNPTGTVYAPSELNALYELCREKGLYFIVDEAYREFVYDGREPFSALQIQNSDAHVVVVDSLSKRFSLCGSRLGCLLTRNQDLLTACSSLAQARLSSPTIEQFAAARMLQQIDTEYLDAVRAEYQSRRDILFELLAAIPDVTIRKPEGAFYTVARLPVDDAEVFARFMLSEFSLNKETTFVAPARGFYSSPGVGHNKIRIAYVLQKEDLRNAVACLAAGLAQFRERETIRVAKAQS